jgi:site-specific DNA-methyltransferase (adenine-specific)
MPSPGKIRAPRNRTLIIDDSEVADLRAGLYCPEGTGAILPAELMDRTIHGSVFDLLPRLPEKFADLIIIDPPYNLDKNFNGFRFKSSSGTAYLEYLRSWLPGVVRLLKDNGSLYLCGDWKCTAALQMALEEQLTVMNRITWQREKGRGAQKNWKNGMEDIWFAVKDPKNYFFNVNSVKQKRKVIAPYKVDGQPKDWEDSADGKFRITYPSNFWDDISVPYWSMPENTDHPTQKPEKLVAKLILASSAPGDVVFDPFLGSGTTAVVAKKLGRNFCGIEMNEAYCLWAEKRLKLAGADTSIQGFEDGLFWERNSTGITKKQSKTVRKKIGT